ncbi:MAG: DNA mismatch repair protein MutS [Acidobacteria bacterium]|nr:DNA mismatch repair protein MutS [Acidobacteriota bacterium]
MVTRHPRKNVQSSAEVSPDDMALFEREVADAQPLAKGDAERVRVAPPAATSGSRSPGVLGSSVKTTEDLAPALESYAAPGVDRRELRKLRRGDYPPEIRLDLHGLMAAEAVARVTRVLAAGSGQRPRCLCVVHGRGLRSPGNVAVLKPRVREALRGHPAVLAFTDAPSNDGGPGAVYVLLRRSHT